MRAVPQTYLEFYPQDGTVQSVGYAPSADQAGLLRSRNAKPPAEFEALIGELLAGEAESA